MSDSDSTICPIHSVDTAQWEHSLPLADHAPCFEAYALVVADQRKGRDTDGYTDAQLLAHARNTIPLHSVYGDDELARAYRLVLSAPEGA